VKEGTSLPTFWKVGNFPKGVQQIMVYKTVPPQYFTLNHTLKSLFSFVKIHLTYVIKSIPFVLILIGLAFYISMEVYGEIDKGIRLPENYASTGLIVNRVLKEFQGLCLIVLLFYSNEIVWHSRNRHFNLIENATPTSPFIHFFSKWLSLNALILVFLTWIIIVGIVFQFIYQYTQIEWGVYAALYYLIALPLMLSAGMIILIQEHVKYKYLGLILSFAFILLTTSSMGQLLGFTHPLMRFNASYTGQWSDMNGWGAYFQAFHWKILFGVGLTVCSGEFIRRAYSRRINSPLLLGLILTLFSGIFIFNKVKLRDREAEKNWQQAYEQKYRPYQNLPQPTITDVKTTIDLFPENNTYKVSGSYILQNKTDKTIEKLLIYADKTIPLKALTVENGKNETQDAQFGHYWFTLSKPLQPNDSVKIDFQFDYSWSAFNGHESFNAIIENGSFVRISNYFPRFGYQSYIEIEDEKERTKRNLGKATPILSLGDPLSIEDDFIHFEAIISTSKNQTAISVGDLVKTWKQQDRNYFQYKTHVPIPFRIGVSSAEYVVQKAVQNGIEIEVYYDPKHAENVSHLLKNAQLTLDYCETNFGKYPFKTIRFAEISAFTRGFAATAYPATIFMAENMVFHANIKGDKQQDVVNELAGHELSHEWWGANQLTTDNREGAKFLTETLAMYTELMLVKKMYGQKRVLENVKMHQDMYLSERGFATEQPLYKTLPDNVHQHYSKGLVTMYQLSEMIGEETVNQALKNFLHKYAYPNKIPISTDLLNELYAVSDTVFHSKIDDLFKKIVTYDMKFNHAQMTKTNQAYTVDFELIIQKFEEDGQGKQAKLSFNNRVEVAFYFEDGQHEFRTFTIGDSSLKTRISLPKKLVKMAIDPHLKFIKLNDNTSFDFKQGIVVSR
jgi:ABC-2 type transport system permease protein